MIQELGGYKIIGGQKVFMITETTHKSLKDMIQMIRDESIDFPYTRYLLLKWGII